MQNSACDKAGEWRLTLGLYDQMRADAATGSAFSKSSPAAMAVKEHDRKTEKGVSYRHDKSGGEGTMLPPPRATVAALTACAR